MGQIKWKRFECVYEKFKPMCICYIPRELSEKTVPYTTKKNCPRLKKNTNPKITRHSNGWHRILHVQHIHWIRLIQPLCVGKWDGKNAIYAHMRETRIVASIAAMKRFWIEHFALFPTQNTKCLCLCVSLYMGVKVGGSMRPHTNENIHTK